MRINFLTIAVLLCCNTANTQAHGAVEECYYWRQGQTCTLVPKVWLQNANDWYTELRYNYEDLQTVSLYAGKEFSRQGKLSYSVLPMLGAVAGRFKGGSLGVNINIDYKNISFSAQSQYSLSAESRNANFFFNWSELVYQVKPWIYTGAALQQTKLYGVTGKWEPGIMVGFSFKRWTFPLYGFGLMGQDRYFVFGVNRVWGNIKSRTGKNNPGPLPKTKETITQ